MLDKLGLCQGTNKIASIHAVCFKLLQVNRAWILDEKSKLTKVVTKSDMLREFTMFEFYNER